MTPHDAHAAVHAHDAQPDPDAVPSIDTAADPFDGPHELRRRWQALMGPLGFGEHRLWFTFVERDTQLITAINTLPLPSTPNARLIDALMKRLGDTLENTIEVSVAVLLSRPGRDGVTAHDRDWAGMLLDCSDRHQVPMQPMFRANDIDLIALDTSPAARASWEEAS